MELGMKLRVFVRHFDKLTMLIDDDNQTVATLNDFGGVKSKENARLIVQAVNAFCPMKEGIESLAEEFRLRARERRGKCLFSESETLEKCAADVAALSLARSQE